MRRFRSTLLRASLISAVTAGLALASGSGTTAVASGTPDAGASANPAATASVVDLLPEIIVEDDAPTSPTGGFVFESYRRR